MTGMPDSRANHAGIRGAGELSSGVDAALVEEFCCLVAEIASRSLTKRHMGPDNETSIEGWR